MKNYPSNITREQFEKIKPLLEKARKKTRPREVDLYEVFCAILYVLKSGCQWRMIPSDFPNWNTVYSYFKKWKQSTRNKESIFEKALKKIVTQTRIKNGRKKKQVL